jgi:hypothetical protein
MLRVIDGRPQRCDVPRVRGAHKDDADEQRPSAAWRSLEENFLHEDKRASVRLGPGPEQPTAEIAQVCQNAR